MRESNDEYVEVEVFCHAKTNKAALLSTDGNEDNAAWVPMSQIDGGNSEPVERGGRAIVQMKEWIAKREGFI